ncbi:MAG: hypothetical protein GY928_23690, partial [Colwellia sp.]|nr:hypothetical protein [Colwellia sp.]
MTEIIDKRMSDVDVIEEQNKELEETRETAEIFLLELCYKALFKVFYINTHINTCCEEFDIAQKQTEDYKYYKDIVEKITYKVVEINSERDLKGFKNDLDRRIQKH